jgi:hypothetical protein
LTRLCAHSEVLRKQSTTQRRLTLATIQSRHRHLLDHAPPLRPTMRTTNHVNESFLRQLLRRHPHGKIWSFGGTGQAHSEDLTSSSSENDELQNSESSVPLTPGTQQRKRRLRESHHDGQVLASMFPGARSVAIHGIRDSGRRRWTAGCLLWSFDPLRVLTIDTEMNFVAAFCDIIAGETRSLEVQRSDRAKSDFISSVSEAFLQMRSWCSSSEKLLTLLARSRMN